MKRGLLDRCQDIQQCIWGCLTRLDAAKKSSYVAKQQKRTSKYSITPINYLTYCFLDCCRSNLFLRQILALFISSSVSAWSVFLSDKFNAADFNNCHHLKTSWPNDPRNIPSLPLIASLFHRHQHSLLYDINYFVDCLFLEQPDQRELIILLTSPNFTIYHEFALTGAVELTSSLLSKHHRKFSDF